MIGRDIYVSNTVKAAVLFQAGIERLSQKRPRSATTLLNKASRLGHNQATNYLKILQSNRRSVALWRDIISAAETGLFRGDY